MNGSKLSNKATKGKMGMDVKKNDLGDEHVGGSATPVQCLMSELSS